MATKREKEIIEFIDSLIEEKKNVDYKHTTIKISCESVIDTLENVKSFIEKKDETE